MSPLRRRIGLIARRRLARLSRLGDEAAALAGRAFIQTTGPQPAIIPVSERRIDPWLFSAVLALVGVGVVMVYSASAIYAARKFGSPRYRREGFRFDGDSTRTGIRDTISIRRCSAHRCC